MFHCSGLKHKMKQEATHVFVVYSHSRIADSINWKVKPNLAVKPAWLATALNAFFLACLMFGGVYVKSSPGGVSNAYIIVTLVLETSAAYVHY